MQSRVVLVSLLLIGCAAAQFDARRSDDFSTKAFVSAVDLRVPARARKEFDKASELFVKQNLTQALQKLNDAIAIYPAYAVAYNNIGVIRGLLGNPEQEREAYEKAISIDDHFALAYVNLGRMEIVAGNFADAEAALNKASAFDPKDPMTLTLLTYSELKDGHLEEAIANSQKAHALSKPHAISHRVAARVYEQKQQFDRAIAELQTFLQEEPSGPRADAARRELDNVRKLRR